MRITPELERIANEIAAERERQEARWGDDTHKTPKQWCNHVISGVYWAEEEDSLNSPEEYRRRMLQVAALAVAACEDFDRTQGRAA